MEITDPQIVSLRAKVKAADEEFDQAIALHEAWKPAAYDADLHMRIGTSYAANTFIVIRRALRREMLLALARMWDSDRRAVGMGSIANSLGDKRIVDALANDVRRHWLSLPNNVEKFPESERKAVLKALRNADQQFADRQSDHTRASAAQAIVIIRSYEKGGEHFGFFEWLQTLRNERLAHRQVTPTNVVHETVDEEVEKFYLANLKLIELLRLAVEDVSYSAEETAEIHRKNAGLFWANVAGEGFPTHPSYKARPPVTANR